MLSQNSDSSEQDFLTVPARMESLAPLQTFAASKAEQAGASFALMPRIELVLEEVLVNVFHYAYPEDASGDVVLECMLHGDEIVFTIVDHGREFNPLNANAADTSLDIDERRIGGLGIHLVRKMVDSITYERTSQTNRLTFSFRLAA